VLCLKRTSITRSRGSCGCPRIRSEDSLPIDWLVNNSRGQVGAYVRANGRSPANEFFGEIEGRDLRKFEGQFDALTKCGKSYCIPDRFKPLRDSGKPLWEFKQHALRLYALRQVVDQRIVVILFNGWSKSKEGKTQRENDKIVQAKTLFAEYLNEKKGEQHELVDH
jgi:hypothetical protein